MSENKNKQNLFSGACCSFPIYAVDQRSPVRWHRSRRRRDVVVLFVVLWWRRPRECSRRDPTLSRLSPPAAHASLALLSRRRTGVVCRSSQQAPHVARIATSGTHSRRTVAFGGLSNTDSVEHCSGIAGVLFVGWHSKCIPGKCSRGRSRRRQRERERRRLDEWQLVEPRAHAHSECRSSARLCRGNERHSLAQHTQCLFSLITLAN